jgi:hypothetical protein
MTNQPGLSLLDIAGATEDVPVGDSFITVSGISAQDGLAIMRRFPQLTSLLGGFKAADLLTVAPGALSVIIAASVNKMGDEEYEAAAAKIGVEIQWDILEAIGRLTFKNGFGPFGERIMALAAKVPNSGNSGRASATNSQPISKPSSPPDTPQP